jgi:hypothetical protein
MILAALVIAAAMVAAPRAMAFAVTVGAGLMVGNALALRRIGARVLASSSPGFAILLLNLKMFVLIALIYVGVHLLHLDAIGLIIGVSVFPVAIVAAALRIGAAESSTESTESPSGER